MNSFRFCEPSRLFPELGARASSRAAILRAGRSWGHSPSSFTPGGVRDARRVDPSEAHRVAGVCGTPGIALPTGTTHRRLRSGTPPRLARAGAPAFALLAFLTILPIVADAASERFMPKRLEAEVLAILNHEPGPEQVLAALDLGRADPSSDAVLDALRKHAKDENPAVQCACLHALGELGVPRSVPWVSDALNDASAEVRVAACEALAALEQGGFRRLPEDDAVPAVRKAVLHAFRKAPWTSSVAARLRTRLRAEEVPDLRAAIFEVYRAHGKLPSAQALKDALRSGEASERFAALKCLRDAATPAGLAETVSPLVAALGTAPVAAVRRAAVQTTPRLPLSNRLDWLRERADDADHTVRKAAGLALGEAALSQQLLETLAMLQRDPNAEVRRAASMSMINHARSEQADTRESIERHAASLSTAPSSPLRCEGLWMLGQLRSRAAFPRILDLPSMDFPSQQDAEDTRSAESKRETRLLAWLVQRSKCRPALPRTIPWFLQQHDSALQYHAARAIEEMRYEPAAPALARAVQKIKVEAGARFYVYGGIGRRAAIEALAALATPEAFAALTSVLQTTDPMDSSVNLAFIARTLARRGNKQEAIRALQQIVRKLERVNADSEIAEVYRELAGKALPERYVVAPARSYQSRLLSPAR